MANEPQLKAIHDFDNPGAKVMERIHRKHRRYNLKTTIVVSVFIQVLITSTVGFVQDWTLVFQAIAAAGIVVVMHKLRTGHLTTIIVAGTTTLLTLYWTGNLGISAFLAMWLLVFWYAFLGYQIKMNNELHGKDTSA